LENFVSNGIQITLAREYYTMEGVEEKLRAF